MVSTSLCNICLRADKKTCALANKLHYFLDELCEFAIVKFDLQYCTECVHRLRNFYKFKQQCVEAIKVLGQWNKDKAKKKESIHSLHTLLPQTLSLGIQDNKNVHFIKQYESQEIQGKYCRSQNIPEKEPKPQKTDYSSTKTTGVLIVNIETTADSSNFINVNQNDLSVNENIVENLLLDNNKKKESLLLDGMAIKLEIDDRNTSKVTEHLEYYDALNGITYLYEDFSFKNGNDDDITGKGDDDDFADIGFDDDVLTDTDEDTVDNNVNNPKIEDRYNEKIVNDDVNDTDKNITEQLSGKISDDSNNWGDDDNINDTGIHDGNNWDDDDNINNTGIHDDISDDDSIVIKRAKLTKLEKKQRRKKPVPIKEPFSKEKLKDKLTYLFKMCKEVKSRDGTILDRDTTLNGVESWPLNNMKFIWKYLNGPQKTLRTALWHLSLLNKYGSAFEITLLDTEEEIMTAFLNRKTYQSYVLAPHKCEICYQGFQYKKRLEYHMKWHDPTNGDFECSVCKAREKSELAITKHKINCHRSVYKCKRCPLITNYSSSMINHYNQHEGRQYKCQRCDLTYASKSSLNSHLMTYHKTQHACPLCARTFVSVYGLGVHQNLKHKGEVVPDAGVTCDLCNIKFVSSEICDKHKRVSHGVGGVMRRKRKTSDNRPRKAWKGTCRMCPATGDNPMWLRTHMRAEHPEWQPDAPAHLCDVCGKGYPYQSLLEQHRNEHTGARPYACEKCPNKFNTLQKLWVHEQRHMPPRWPCQECGKKFFCSTKLNTHKKIHIGDRRFKCQLCPAAFLYRGALEEHVRGVHCQQRRIRKPRNKLKPAV